MTVTAALMNIPNGVRIGIASALAVAGVTALVRLYRPWHLRWGATHEEALNDLPGDGVVVDPTFNATRAITVDAPPEAVWPWIAQMGFGRAGWYSYDLLDNLGRRSADRIIPSLQDVRVGDVVPMGPGGGGLRVKDFVRGEWLLWWDGIGHSTWLWHLERIAPGQTRLVTRVRTHYRWTHPTILFALLLLEPWDFPMMRKCMLGKHRNGQRVVTSSRSQEQVSTTPALPQRTSVSGHKTDTSETTHATPRDASPARATTRFAGETVSRMVRRGRRFESVRGLSVSSRSGAVSVVLIGDRWLRRPSDVQGLDVGGFAVRVAVEEPGV